MQQCTRYWVGGIVALVTGFAPGFAHALEFPPVRVSGELGYDFRMDRFEGGDDLLEHIGRFRINGATYIWQPWLAQLDGGVGLNLRTEDRDSGDRSGYFATGDARLRLFPFSRFPFEAFVERTNTDFSGNLTGLKLERTRFGAQQRYTTKGGTGFRVRLERIMQTQDQRRDGDRDDTTDLLQFGVSRSFAKHNLMFDTNATRTTRDDLGDKTTRKFSSLRHQYRPGPTLSVEDLLSYNQTEFDRSDTDFSTQVLQLNSFAFWRPDTAKPLLVNGTLRVRGNTTESGSEKTSAEAVTTTIGGRYQWSPRWSFVSDAGLTQRFFEDGDDLSHFQRAGARYVSDNIPLGDFEYNWSGFGEVNNTSGELDSSRDREGAVQGVELELGHDLSRRGALYGGALFFNVGQTGTEREDTSGRSSQTLLHNIALSWNRQSGTASTFARLSASDSRTFGGGGRFGDEDNEFQLVNLQLSRDQALGRASALSGNVTLQGVRQVSTAGDDGKWRPSAALDITYRHQRAFGVPNLRFRSTLRLFSDSYLPLIGRAQEPNERKNKEWENRLEYTIGRLDLRLIGRYSEIAKQGRTLLLLQMTRRFGDI